MTDDPHEITQKQFERLGARAATKGCDRCRSRLAAYLPYFVVRTAGQRLVVVCESCILAPDKLLGTATHSDEDPWIGDDREWFSQHPNRTMRMREAFPGELRAIFADVALLPDAPIKRMDVIREALSDPSVRWGILVLQIKPGNRAREPFRIGTTDPLDSFTDAGIERIFPESCRLARERFAGVPDAMAEQNDQDRFRRRLAATAGLVKDL